MWSEGAPVVVAETPQRGRSGRRYRIIEDPDVIEKLLKKEEKTLTKQRRQLVILQKKADSSAVEGALYKQAQERIEKLEAKIDDRLLRIAELMAAIQEGFDDEEDEEEVLLMS